MYGNTDLGDYYRGRLTLRQILARIRALPSDAPLSQLLESMQEQSRQAAEMHDHEAALTPFKAKG